MKNILSSAKILVGTLFVLGLCLPLSSSADEVSTAIDLATAEAHFGAGGVEDDSAHLKSANPASPAEQSPDKAELKNQISKQLDALATEQSNTTANTTEGN
jgi:hypothetical protein